MSATAFLYNMPATSPGVVSSLTGATIVPEILDSTGVPTQFGRVVKLVSGKLREIASGDAADVIYGFNVKAFPSGNTQDGLSAATPPTSGVQDVLRAGTIGVKLNHGTAAKGGAVYVRVTADTGKAVGDIETAADSGKCVAVPRAFFRGAADADGFTEIEVALA